MGGEGGKEKERDPPLYFVQGPPISYLCYW